jgi:hypothetical protein
MMTKRATEKPVIAYVRVSSKAQCKSELGLEAQEQARSYNYFNGVGFPPLTPPSP